MGYSIPHLWVKATTYVVYYTTNMVYYTTNVNSPEIPILLKHFKDHRNAIKEINLEKLSGRGREKFITERKQVYLLLLSRLVVKVAVSS